MELVLVRHASRHEDSLTARGEHQVERLASALENRDVHPSLFLSSRAPYAQRTRDMLADRLTTDEPAVRELCSPLDPVPGNPSGIDNIVAALHVSGVELDDHGSVLLVGHEGRLSSLLVQLIGERSRPVPRGGAVGVRGDSFEALLKGCGKIDFRFPVVDHQEAELRPKVQSKMTVATFLAGFVSAALVTTLFVDDFSAPRQVATVLLTVALALFVVTIYVYDELSMPEGFWLGGRHRGLRRRLEEWREGRIDRRWYAIADGEAPRSQSLRTSRWIKDERAWRQACADEVSAQGEQDGPLYTWMVATWHWVFTPALLLALAGFGVLIADAGSIVTAVACGISVLIAVIWLAVRSPPLGTD